jgi:hypothetical protein
MDATYDLATSGDNTPTQLLSLQRLADFPLAPIIASTKDNWTSAERLANRKTTFTESTSPKNASI